MNKAPLYKGFQPGADHISEGDLREGRHKGHTPATMRPEVTLKMPGCYPLRSCQRGQPVAFRCTLHEGGVLGVFLPSTPRWPRQYFRMCLSISVFAAQGINGVSLGSTPSMERMSER